MRLTTDQDCLARRHEGVQRRASVGVAQRLLSQSRGHAAAGKGGGGGTPPLVRRSQEAALTGVRQSATFLLEKGSLSPLPPPSLFTSLTLSRLSRAKRERARVRQRGSWRDVLTTATKCICPLAGRRAANPWTVPPDSSSTATSRPAPATWRRWTRTRTPPNAAAPVLPDHEALSAQIT